MLPIKKLLCPTDFSEPSYRAMEAAAELAGHFQSKLYLVHVVYPVPVMATPPPPAAFNIPGYQEKLEESARKGLAKEVERRIPKGITAHEIVVTGLAADEIVRIASEEGIDMIVIATHGRTGIRRLIFGSVAERVLRHATCPVLTIRPEQEQ